MAQVVQNNTAPASYSDMATPMQKLGKKQTTSFEKLKKSVVAEFGESKVKELANHKASIQSLKQKNVAENWRIAGGVVAGIAIAALGVAGLVGAILVYQAAALAAVALEFILMGGIASIMSGFFGGICLSCHIEINIAKKNISRNNETMTEHGTKVSKIYGDLEKIINKKTQNGDERNRLFDAVINHIEANK